jgi:ligand-binding sensor domain-containing protein
MMHEKLHLIFVYSLVISNVFCYSQTWEKISEQEITGHVYSLQFDSDGKFYAASANGLFCSTDRGESWNNIYPTYNFDNYVSNVLLIKISEILIGVRRGINTILYSNDGGLTWSGDSSNIGIDFLVMDKEGNIYAGWEPIYKSTDKGHSWNVLKDSLYTWSFYITSSGNLLAGTTCGIYLSTDSGNSWTRTGYFDCGDITFIKGVNNDEIIFIVGADRFRGIRYSADGGYNWEYVSNSDTIRWGTSILPINNYEVYFGSQFYGVFKYNTKDSSLVGVNDGLQYGVSAMAYDSLGYLYTSSDGIYRSRNTLDTSKYIRNSVYNYSLAQNYPNPFNSNTTIEYSLETPGQVYITVYNLLGENVAEILNESKSKGKYQIVFNASRLASGIYFYQMRVGNFSQIKKMVLLR